MTVSDGIVIVGAYLWGGIPTAYLVARFASGIDIRNYGSGNVGASNALAHVGVKTGVAIGLFDLIGKGILPVLLARAFDVGLGAQAAAGLAAIAGHNWSPYIRFTGGRGVGTTGGVILAFALWHEAVIATILIAGLGRLVLKDTGLLTLIAIIVLPASAFTLGLLELADRPAEVVIMCALIGVLLAVKRMTANWEPLPSEQPVLQTAVCRILWDRDVSRQQEWTGRTPAGDVTEAAEQ